MRWTFIWKIWCEWTVVDFEIWRERWEGLKVLPFKRPIHGIPSINYYVFRPHPAYCNLNRCVASSTAHIEVIDSGKESIKNPDKDIYFLYPIPTKRKPGQITIGGNSGWRSAHRTLRPSSKMSWWTQQRKTPTRRNFLFFICIASYHRWSCPW